MDCIIRMKGASMARKRKSKKKRAGAPGTRPLHNSKARDSTAKLVLGDSYLCAQFLRDYVGLDICRNVQPDDIEDVSERFLPMFVDEREADLVKVIRIPDKTATVYDNADKAKEPGSSGRDGSAQADASSREAAPPGQATAYGFCYILLVEHKSQNYNDIFLQLLRYIVEIWTVYRKDAIKNGWDPGSTDFRYPPVLPLVYYDGREDWSAPRELPERVFLGEAFREFLPQFSYLLVDLRRKHPAEFYQHADEVSFIMLLERLRSLEEFASICPGIPKEMWEQLEMSPEHVLDIITQVTALLLRGLEFPETAVRNVEEKIKERKVYRMFEDFEKPKVGLWDMIQGYDILLKEKEDWQKERSGLLQERAGWQQERSGLLQRESQLQQEIAELKAQLQMA